MSIIKYLLLVTCLFAVWSCSDQYEKEKVEWMRQMDRWDTQIDLWGIRLAEEPASLEMYEDFVRFKNEYAAWRKQFKAWVAAIEAKHKLEPKRKSNYSKSSQNDDKSLGDYLFDMAPAWLY